MQRFLIVHGSCEKYDDVFVEAGNNAAEDPGTLLLPAESSALFRSRDR
jgi:hypothetical protein